MSKATLSFVLPEERVEHSHAVHGHRFLSALQDIRQALRDKVKYSETGPVSWEEVQQLFFDKCCEAGVDVNAEEGV